MKRVIIILLLLLMFPVLRVSAQSPDTLTLALYPYVPDIERFKSAIREEWDQRHPEIRLEFTDWDCYSGTLPENADVFVYDGVFLNNYLTQGMLLPLARNEVEALDDFYPFVTDTFAADEVIYAVPEFLCSEFLYTRRDDTELTSVENIRELYDVLGELDTEAAGVLPLNEGLLVNIPTKLNASFWFVQALVDAEQAEPEVIFPLSPSMIPEEAAESLWMIRKMAGIEDMTLKVENGGSYIYGEWFTDGVGRAYIGFSEAMSVMGASADEMDVRLYSMTEDNNIPLFYADLASVNANISEEKRGLAVELLNVITGTEVLVKASSPMNEGQSFQYLLSARKSVYDELGQKDNIYTELETIVSDPENRIFNFRNEDLMSLYDSNIVYSLLRMNRTQTGGPMNVIDCILSRHSYRGKYRSDSVPREHLELIMKAGLAAPSGCNKQTASLIAVDDPEVLSQLHAVIDPPVGETAPAMICVLSQKIIAYANRCFAVQDYAAAIENMLLAITALGYQSCWYEGHITDKDRICDKMAAILNVPDDYDLVCFLPVGIAESEPVLPKKKPFEDRAWFNSFQTGN